MNQISWLAGTSGNWSNASLWQGGVYPVAGDDAIIDAAGSYTVTISTAEASHSITLNAASAQLAIDSALALGGTLDAQAGSVLLQSAGEISGGTIVDAGSHVKFQAGTLDGVTYDGTLDLTAQGASAYVTGAGLTAAGADGTGAGTILVGKAGQNNGAIYFEDSQTIDNATIVLNGYYGGIYQDTTLAYYYANHGHGGTLTLGPDLTIDQPSGNNYLTGAGFGGSTIINEGTIDAAASGGQMFIRPTSFTNSGTIDVSHDDTVDIQPATFTNTTTGSITVEANSILYLDYGSGTLTNAGTITVDAGGSLVFGTASDVVSNTGTIIATGATLSLDFNGPGSDTGSLAIAQSTVKLYGSITTAMLAPFANQGDIVDIYGTLNNAGATLAVGTGSALGQLVLVGGTITGGTIQDSGYGIRFSSGTLDGVTYEGTLDLPAQGALVYVTTAGLTLTGLDGTGAGTVLLGSVNQYYGGMSFADSQTIDNATIVLNGYNGGISQATSSTYYLAHNDHGGTLTLGAHLTLDQESGQSGLYTNGFGGTIVNDGTIDAAGYSMSIQPASFINNGIITDSNDDSLYIRSGTFTNTAAGSIIVEAGSSLFIQNGSGTLTNAGTITVEAGGLLAAGYAGDVLSNTGTIAATDATVSFDLSDTTLNTGALVISQSTVDLYGSFTTANIALFAGQGDTIRIYGRLVNTGATLAVGTGSALGQLVLENGSTITGGTIQDSGAGFAFDGGTLDGVTYDGTMDLTAGGASVSISSAGLTATGADGTGNGTILVGTAGQYDSDINFDDSQTIDNATIDLNGSYGGIYQDTSQTFYNANSDQGGTLTLGPDLTTDQQSGFVYLSVNGDGGGTIVNEGTIDAAASGGTLEISPTSFTNQGLINVSNGDEVNISAGTVTNTMAGSIIVGSGSSLNIANGSGTLTNAGTITIQAGGSLAVGTGSDVLSNTGTIAATDATVSLDLSDTTGNTGTLIISQSTVALYGSFTTATVAMFAGQGDTVQIYGTLDNTGATLAVGTGSARVQLVLESSGTITGGTIEDSSAGIDFQGGVLDGVTYDGTLDLTAPSASVYVTSAGLTATGADGTGDGTILVGAAGPNGSEISFDDNQTIDHAAIVLNGYDSGVEQDTTETYFLANNDQSGTLTLGPDLTIDQAGGIGILTAVGYGPGTIINEGTIDVAASGASLVVDPANFTNDGVIDIANGDTATINVQDFINSGTIDVSDGGTLTLAYAPTEFGDISVDATSQVNLGGTYTLAELAALQLQAGAVVELDGSLDNSSGTLSVGPGNAISTLLLNGTISGGTIVDTGSGVAFNGGTLDGVTYDGTMDLSGQAPANYVTGPSVYVTGLGLTVAGVDGTGNGTILVGSTAQYTAGINFEDTQTIDNATIILNGAGGVYQYTTSAYYSANNDQGGTLILGPGLTIDLTSGTGTLATGGNGAGTIINEGTIDAAALGGALYISPASFINQGVIDISSQGSASISGDGFTNTGAIDVTDGATLSVSGSPAELGDVSVDGSSTLDLTGSFTLAELAGLQVQPGGVVNLSGSLDNSGGTLFVGPGSAIPTLALTGTISGGTIVDSGSGMAFQGGTLDGVTYDGTLDLSPQSAAVYVTDAGLTAAGVDGTGDGTILVGSDGQTGSTISFEDSQTIDNATIELNGNSSSVDQYTTSAYYAANGQGGTLALGPNLLIDQSSGSGLLSAGGSGSGTIVNEGTIDAAAAGGSLVIQPGFTNQGVIEAADGDSIEIDSPSNLAGGTLTGGIYAVDAGSTITMPNGPAVATLDADLSLTGTGSTFTAGGSPLEASLTDIGTQGVLRIFGGRDYTATNDITVDGTLQLGGGTFQANSLTIDAGGTLSGFGTLDDPYNDGGILALGGDLDIEDPISGAGSAAIGAAATLELGGADAETVDFAGANGTLKLDDPQEFSGTITGFAQGDAIDLVNATISQAGLVDITPASAGLQFTLTGGATLTFTLLGDFSGAMLGTAGDTAGTGTDLVIGTNQPPVLSNTGTSVTFTQGGPSVALDAALGVSDGTSSVLASVTLAITAGLLAGDTLGFVDTTDITGSFDPATGTLVLSGVASLAEYQAALDAITFSSTSDNPTDFDTDQSRTITWVADNGAALENVSAPVTTTVAVVAVVQPPVLANTADVVYSTGGPAVLVDPTLALTDANSTLASGATITITGGLQPDDTLNFAAQNGITGVYDNGVLTLSGSASLTDYQTALQSITYSSSNGDPTLGDTDASRSLSWQVSNAAGLSNTLATTITLYQLSTSDTWTNLVNGDWSTAADWSTGTVPDAATDAAITVAGPAYTVTVSDAEAARSLLLGTSAATLAVAGTLSVTTTLSLSAGTLALTGTLDGGTVARGAGTLLAQGGTLAGVTYDGTLDLSAAGASLTVLDDITLAGADGSGRATVLTGDGSRLLIANDTPDAVTTLDNAIFYIGADDDPYGAGAGIDDIGYQSTTSTLVLGSLLDIAQAGRLASIVGQGGPGDDITNDGTISGSVMNGQFTIQDANFNNAGSIAIGGTDTLEIDDQDTGNTGQITVSDQGSLAINATVFTNAGTLDLNDSGLVTVSALLDNTGAIVMTGGELTFTTQVDTDGLGAISHTGGIIDITGTLDNTGATLDIGTGTALGQIDLDGGTIIGGVIDDFGDGLVAGGTNALQGTLDGVTYQGALHVQAAPYDEGALVITNGIALEGADGTGPGTLEAPSYVQFDDTTTLDNATVILDGAVQQYPMGGGNHFAAALYDHDTTGNGAVLTLGSHLTLTGSAGGVFTDVAVGDGLVNQGSILFGDGGTFSIGAASFTNAGLLQASDGAQVALDGDWTDTGTTVIETGAELDFGGYVTTAQFNRVVYAGGIFALSGTLDNTGSTLNISQALGDFVINFSAGDAATILGGTVDVAAGTSLAVLPGYFPLSVGTLDGVTFEGTLDLSAGSVAILLTDDSTLRNATVLLTGSGSTLTLDATTTLLDTTIDIGNDYGGATLDLDGTFAAGSSIIQVGSMAAIDPNDFVNQGTIAAEYSGGAFDLLGDSFSNAGSLAVGNGDSLDVQTGVFANTATIALSGGTIAGTALTNSGSISGYGTLADAVTNDGMIEATGGLLSLAGSISGTGSLQVDSLATLELGGAVAAGAVVTFDGQGATLKLDDPATFAGTIAGFGEGNTIDLAGVADAASASISGNTLTVSLQGGGSVTLSFDASSYGGGQLTVGSDGAGGTTITDLQPAVPAPHMPLSYDLGAHHVGDVASRALSLTNIGGPLAAALEANLGGATAGVTASGTASIAAGATDSQHLLIGLDTSTAGAKSGTATIDLASQGSAFDSLGTTSLGDEVLQVTGAVYALARAAFSDTTPVLHVGDSGIEHLTVSNVSGDGAYSEGLISTAESATGVSGASGTTGLIADGASASLAYDVDTATAGVIDGLIKVGLTSDGSGTSGLGQTDLATASVPVDATIDNYATAAVALIGTTGSLTQAGAAYTLNLGTLVEGSGPITARFAVANTATGLADLLSGAFNETGSTGFTNAGLAAFTGLGAGQSDTAPAVTLSTSQTGTFSETITLDATGSNASGYSGALTPDTITIVGTVTPATVQSTGSAGSPGGTGKKGTAGQPGTATADAANTPVNAAQAQGGAGGAGGNGASSATVAGGNAAPGAAGGNATAGASTSNPSSSMPATATATATGGTGGAAGAPGQGTTTGHGAAGGNGGASTATASATNTDGAANASATSDGGTGGAASSTGGAGGNGGTASGTTASAHGTTSATAAVTQTGGNGGTGSAGASGGYGASSTLTNAVSGTTDDGTLTLSQDANGGDGGDSDTSSGGAAGAASSSLTVDDTQSQTVDATVAAQGGNAGAGGLYHPQGGTAAVYADITGAHDVTATGTATGGTSPEGLGGAANASVTGTGGGMVTASATSTGGAGAANPSGHGWSGGASTGATATASGAAAVATATGVGGEGGGGTGAGNAGGAGATATGTSATATGTTSASASATQIGGAGGAGSGGAAGGVGAGSSLINAVSGTTDDGTLTLTQVADGGAGGASDTGAGGAGGSAISDLTVDDTENANRSASITAAVTGAGGASSGVGGSTWDAATVTGAGTVAVTTTADGGSGAQGGTASASTVATGVAVQSKAIADGGAGQTTAGTATANAKGVGTSGTVEAASSTALAGGPVASVSGDATAAVGGTATAGAQASFGGAVPSFVTGTGAEAIVKAMPTAASVVAVLAADPTTRAALGATPAYYAVGELGGGHSASGTNSQTSTASTDIRLDLLQLDSTPDLFLAFSRPTTAGAGISGIALTVSADGTSLLSESFASATAAKTWFSDHPIDLGSLSSGVLAAAPTLDLQVALSVTSSQAGSSFQTQFLLGGAAANPAYALV